MQDRLVRRRQRMPCTLLPRAETGGQKRSLKDLGLKGGRLRPRAFWVNRAPVWSFFESYGVEISWF